MKFKLIFKMNIIIMNVMSYALSLFRFFAFKRNKFLKKNILLKNYKKSNVCTILGLGPSLNNCSKNDISGDIIVVNRFIISSLSDQIEPTFYIILDEKFYKEYIDILQTSIKRYKNTVFILNLKYINCLSKEIMVKKNIHFVAPWKGTIKKHIKFKSLRSFLPLMPNVLLMALYLSIALNYSNINLYGADFNSFCFNSNVHSYNQEVNKSFQQYEELFLYSYVSFFHKIISEIATKQNNLIKNNYKESLLNYYRK